MPACAWIGLDPTVGHVGHTCTTYPGASLTFKVARAHVSVTCQHNVAADKASQMHRHETVSVPPTHSCGFGEVGLT